MHQQEASLLRMGAPDRATVGHARLEVQPSSSGTAWWWRGPRSIADVPLEAGRPMAPRWWSRTKDGFIESHLKDARKSPPPRRW